MCKVGDIIVINEFKNEYGEIVSKHSFVVISDEEDFIKGFKYDFVANMLCSFHGESHKRNKLRFKQNFTFDGQKISGNDINHKEGFIKADQLYYFNKNNIDYKIIAHIDDKLLNDLIRLIKILVKENLLISIYSNIK